MRIKSIPIVIYGYCLSPIERLSHIPALATEYTALTHLLMVPHPHTHVAFISVNIFAQLIIGFRTVYKG